jgi:Putative zinc-finger/Predicted integral membrane protein (DUF2275)
MTCQDIEQNLPAYLEDTLSPDEKKSVADHLAACPRCSRALADLKKAQELLRGLDEVEPPPFFEQRIMARIRQEAASKPGFLRKSFFPLRIRVPIQILSTIAVAFIAYHVYQQGAQEMKQVAPPPEPMTRQDRSEPSPKAGEDLAAPSAAMTTKRRPPGQQDGKDRLQYAAPPPASSSKAEKTAEIPVPLNEEVLPMPPRLRHDAIKKKAGPHSQGGILSTSQDEESIKEAEHPPEIARQSERKKEQKADQSIANREGRQMMSAPAPFRAATAKAKQETIIGLTIKVGDIPASVRQVKMRLGQINARIIRQEHLDDGEILKAEVFTRHLTALTDNLQTMGRLDWDPNSLNTSDEFVTVMIKIIGNP